LNRRYLCLVGFLEEGRKEKPTFRLPRRYHGIATSLDGHLLVGIGPDQKGYFYPPLAVGRIVKASNREIHHYLES